MWLAIVFFTAPAVISLPMPMPGSALSFAITVKLRLPWRTSSSIRRSGVPTPMNPPIITACAIGDQRHGVLQQNGLHWAVQPPSTGSAMPRIWAAAGEHRKSAAAPICFRRCELERRLLFTEQLHLCRFGE